MRSLVSWFVVLGNLAVPGSAQEVLHASPLPGWPGVYDSHFELLETGPSCRFVHGSAGWDYPHFSITGAGYVGVRSWNEDDDEVAFLGQWTGESLGTWIANLGDVNGNGTSDLGISGYGATYLYDTADWSQIATGPYRVIPWPDVDGDGLRDVLLDVPDPSLYHSPDYSSPVWTLLAPSPFPLPTPPPSGWLRLAPIHDWLLVDDHDGDGIDDFLVSYAGKHLSAAPNDHVTHTLTLYSGATGAILQDVRPGGEWQFQNWGTGVASAGDLTGDGVEDFVVRSALRNDPGCPDFPPLSSPGSSTEGVGSVNLIDGATWQPIDAYCPPLDLLGVNQLKLYSWGSFPLSPSYPNRSASPLVVPDVDGNGAPEVLLDFEIPNESGIREGYAVLMDSVDHDPIWIESGEDVSNAGYTF